MNRRVRVADVRFGEATDLFDQDYELLTQQANQYFDPVQDG